jgi:hypothetical protein
MPTTMKEKVKFIQSQAISIVIITSAVFFFLLGVIEKQVILGLGVSIISALTIILNRIGKINIACSIVIFLLEACAAYVLLIRLETTGITILLISLIVVSACLYDLSIIIVALVNFIILTIYMYMMKQMFSNLFWTRYLTQLTLTFLTFTATFVIKKLLMQVNVVDFILDSMKLSEIRTNNVQEYNQQIEYSIKQIIYACSSFEQGNRKARVKITEENILQDISYLVNNILSRQEKLLATKDDHEKIRIICLNLALEIYKKKENKMSLEKTHTVVDSVINVINGHTLTKQNVSENK